MVILFNFMCERDRYMFLNKNGLVSFKFDFSLGRKAVILFILKF